MTINELTQTIERIIQVDKKDPTSFRPIVAIGHTKELADFETTESFLSYLMERKINISTFEDVYRRCK
jgi:hypothetical protein